MASTAGTAPDRRQRNVALGSRIFGVSAFAVFLFFLLSVVNAILAGGRMGLRSSSMWDETVRWPAIPLPAVVVIATCLAAVVGVLIVAVNANDQEAIDLIGTGAVSFVLFGLLTFYFATIYTSTTGLPMDRDSYPEEGLGWHWIGSALQLVSLVVIAVRLTVRARNTRRSRREE
jgi:hypothetical protein